MIEPIHFYHLWCDGDPHLRYKIIAEHFALMARSNLFCPVVIGLVGTKEHRKAAILDLDQWMDWEETEVFEFDEGFEQCTLQKMHDLAPLMDAAQPILYTHAKGSYRPSLFQERWRQEMDELLIGTWSLRVKDLQAVDAIGLHWLTQEENPWAPISSPFFGGNFWWATAGFIARLPEPSTESRHHAEGWLGQGSPRVVNLRPGWPVY